ncbi:alkaline phosphatase [Rubrivirga sp. S365]|uniref:Alkaline phosphatase n=1 Tax=Rubrivirga litoralis TaxID=3075598 RepID=A0ABU3BV63_9BACT|nr:MULTISPECIES: alkaline phosphatase [unclassified Rubrivirga]MDT0633125.1 alkaline phosphatase [Rubrivirga sp. F394]MDT7855322.1 alkaline phosphatase [Rubrivirga sp. S365]
MPTAPRPARSLLPLAAALALLAAPPATAQDLPDAPSARPVALDASRPTPAGQPRNVVLMIADGFGPASATLGRAAKGAPLALDSVLVGTAETSATDSRVTDSAAGATAYSCGIKTYNGAIAVDADGAPCRTLLEAAEDRGMATGLVATSRITHATPASFAAHVARRSEEPEIARQMAASGVDLLFGGGRRFFTAPPEGAAAPAGAWGGAGGTLATDRSGYDAIDRLPAAALLADSHLAYEIDRDETDQPALADMAVKALDLLAASPDGEERGFFLLVEGSRIDHAAHGNDPAAHLGDILAYDDAVAAVLAWAARDGNTLVVSTADHETGGLTLGRDGVYVWDPAPLLAATASFERMRERVADGEDAAAVLEEGTGAPLPEGAADAARGAVRAEDTAALAALVTTIESEPAGVAWTTSGHTAVDVNVYAWGPGAGRFRGAMGNDAAGRALFEALGLDRE